MQIRFEFTTKYGTYKDALNLADDHAFTEEELNQMKQLRVDRWVYNIENPAISDLTTITENIPIEEAAAE